MECLSLKTETRWDKHFFPSWFLHTAADKIRNEAGVIFKEVDLKARVKELHKRYTTFMAVLRISGAWWSMEMKSVLAPDESWDKILKVNSFAGAYFYKEEHIYASLACLFGMDDVKVEGEPNVVVISDTTEELPADDITTIELVDNENEVNSPNVFPGPRVRRKLFDDPVDPNDQESMNHPGIYVIDVDRDGQVRTRTENDRILPKPAPLPNHLAGPSNSKSPLGSSCGSNYPIGWWPHNFKKP